MCEGFGISVGISGEPGGVAFRADEPCVCESGVGAGTWVFVGDWVWRVLEWLMMLVIWVRDERGEAGLCGSSVLEAPVI